MFVSTISNAVFIFSLVLQIPCFCLLMWPLSVAGAESGRCFCIERAVNPGHVEKSLLLIDFSSVSFGGQNVTWWRYLMSMFFNFIENALYAMCLVFLVSVLGDVVL